MSPTSPPSTAVPLSRTAIFLFAWVLSVLPLTVDGGLQAALGDGSRLALSWLPWIAFVGMPGAATEGRDWLLALGLCVPVTAVALWVDQDAGLLAGRLHATNLAGVVALCTIGESRYLAARSDVPSYAPCWFVLVLGLPGLATALAWGAGGRLMEGTWAELLASLSPLSAMWRDVRQVDSSASAEFLGAALFCPSTMSCVVLVVVMAVLSRRGRAA